jgi:magnesium transporter
MFKTRYPIPGTAPATLTPLAEGEGFPPVIHLVEYTPEGVTERVVASVAELPDLNTADGKMRWIEFNGLGDIAALQALGEKYNLHPLALEDVIHTGQRPKADSYENQLFLVAQMIYRDTDDRLCGEQVSFFLFKGLLHHHPGGRG